MAKVTEPNETLANTKRLGEKILFKTRREGIVVNLQSPIKPLAFTTGKWKDTANEEIERAWNSLGTEEKNKWIAMGADVYMDGKTLFSQEEKKRMINGFYGIATYGVTRYKGFAETKYSIHYGTGVYGVVPYKNK